MNVTETDYASLKDRVVFVTGGGSGIGASLVESFLAQGASVAFVDVDVAASEALVARLGAEGRAPLFIPTDITDLEALGAAVRQTTETLGPIQVLVNNAGWDHRHAVGEVTPDLWDQVQAVNLRPHFFTAQEVAPAMAEAGGGSIINVSSNCWLLAIGGYPGYAAAKAGIVGLTRGLARDLGPSNIRVNALLPGWVMTERQLTQWLTPEAERELLEQQCLKRKLLPEDVSNLALFLGSDDSQMITGQSLIVDGGRA